jgi:hypothetical protein
MIDKYMRAVSSCGALTKKSSSSGTIQQERDAELLQFAALSI